MMVTSMVKFKPLVTDRPKSLEREVLEGWKEKGVLKLGTQLSATINWLNPFSLLLLSAG